MRRSSIRRMLPSPPMYSEQIARRSRAFPTVAETVPTCRGGRRSGAAEEACPIGGVRCLRLCHLHGWSGQKETLRSEGFRLFAVAVSVLIDVDLILFDGLRPALGLSFRLPLGLLLHGYAVAPALIPYRVKHGSLLRHLYDRRCNYYLSTPFSRM
jgi:hypothetical protein